MSLVIDEGASLSLDRRLFGGLNAILFDHIVCATHLCRPRAGRVLVILPALLRSLVPQGTMECAWIRAVWREQISKCTSRLTKRVFDVSVGSGRCYGSSMGDCFAVTLSPSEQLAEWLSICLSSVVLPQQKSRCYFKIISSGAYAQGLWPLVMRKAGHYPLIVSCYGVPLSLEAVQLSSTEGYMMQCNQSLCPGCDSRNPRGFSDYDMKPTVLLWGG